MNLAETIEKGALMKGQWRSVGETLGFFACRNTFTAMLIRGRKTRERRDPDVRQTQERSDNTE